MPVPEMDRSGPSHSAYSQEVVPAKTTTVSSARSVRSRVVPEGTVTAEIVMVAQSALDALAEAAPSDPLKVQESRLARVAAGVGAGATAGLAMTTAEPARTAAKERCIVKVLREWNCQIDQGKGLKRT